MTRSFRVQACTVIVAMALAGSAAAAAQVAAQPACDRPCLEGLVDTYLDALAAHDVQRVRLAADVRITENGVAVVPGEGLWKTAGPRTDYRIYVADVAAGQAGFIGTILQSDGKPLMLALRLKIVDRAIREVEMITGAPFELPGSPLLASPRPALARAVPMRQRLSREQMIAVVERNFDGIVAADGSHFADDCQRVENRMAMSGNPLLDYPIATLPGVSKPAFAAMGCREQVEAHLFDTLDSVTSRRHLVIDEERQLVFGVYMLNWYRDTQCNEVKNYGRVCRPAGQQPTGLRVAEILRVADGRVHEVEVVFSFAPYAAPSGWESSKACDRSCLKSVLDQYLAALAARDPSRLAVTADLRATENGATLKLGEGLWQTATGIGEYRIDALDPVAGQVGFIGEVQEGSEMVSIGLRIKVKEARIAEIETVLGRSFRPKHPSMPSTPRPSLSLSVPAAERLTREQMIATVNANFDGILANRGDIFADDCQRIENRMPMSGNPQLDYPITALPDKPKPAFGAMGCREQVEAHLFDTLDRVDPRRTLVLDEERQTVFGLYMMRFYGRTACNDIPNYGLTCPKTEQKPISLRSAEVLGVRGGKIHEVEVVFTRAEYDATTGW
jgi:hypothetical protein